MQRMLGSKLHRLVACNSHTCMIDIPSWDAADELAVLCFGVGVMVCRAIAQANITREYLHTLVQNDFKMPSGPVIISPHGLLPSLYR
jgi:hypothetical protein